MKKATSIAGDVAQAVLEVAVSHRPGQVAARHRPQRSEVLTFFAQQPAAIVVLAACGSASYWARRIERLGHHAVLLPPQHVRRYRAGNKTDRADAKALLEAFRNEEIRSVPAKTPAQQTLTALHRMRSAWIGTRTSRLNTIRGLLREQGLPIPPGAGNVVRQVLAWIEDAQSSLSAPLRFVLFEACTEVRALEERIRQVEAQLEVLAKATPLAVRLRSVPGVGLLTATALAGFVGDLSRFRTSRHFASYLGLTPREHSSGNIRRLGAIRKRGDVYLRTLLTHGARSVLAAAPRQAQPDRLRHWALELSARVGHNRATIALANKLARYAWAVATRDANFEMRSTWEGDQDPPQTARRQAMMTNR